MSEENITKALFKLGMPMVISMLVMALYNVVDTYFVSGLGKQSVAAVSVAFPISLIFSGIGLTFGAGASSYISRLLEGKNKKEADVVATLISQLVTGLIYLFYFKGGKSFLEIKLSNFKPISAIYKEILKVGISMFLLQIFSSISISKISSSSSASLYGEEAIAAMGIVLRIVTLGTKDILKYELFQKRFLVNLLRKTFPVVLLDSSIAGVHKSFQAKKKKPYQLLLSSF
ncbi:MATE family efflux transporter [Fusobacterium necrophorum]|uniref:MATE family efflux transporter n=1 Tax=Fusobacterium necrophorum TaxID=859 RepID=UPI001C9CE7FC|nr:MATE family efflux transporter [Fusobacterium necrophorum]